VGGRHMPLTLYPRKRDAVCILLEAGWAQGLVWTGEENFSHPGFDPGTDQPAASRYYDYAIVAHNLYVFQILGHIM